MSRLHVPGRRLTSAFFARPTLVVARELLGAVLVHETDEGLTAARLVEVEAYVGESDPGCHAAAGPTRRNAPLYGPPGLSYVYLNYGVHCLLNVVTEDEGAPAAVLLRAAEPLEGTEVMRARRRSGGAAGRVLPDVALCRGPGNLARAFGVTLAHNARMLTAGRLRLVEGVPVGRVRWTRRIGLSRGGERYWRCVEAGSAAVSGTRAWNDEARSRPRPLSARADRRS